MKLEFDRDRALFAIAAFVFIIEIAGIATYSVISKLMLTLELLLTVLFVAYAICYLLYSGRRKAFGFLESCFKPLFISIVTILIVQVLYAIFAIGASFYSVTQEPTLIFALLPALLPPMLLIFFARYVGTIKAEGKQKRKIKLFSYALVIGAIAFVVVIYLSGVFGSSVSFDDEEFISVMAAHALVSGQNPYAVSFQGTLYNYSLTKNFSGGLTDTTNGLFESGVDYPALSFLIFAPFVALSNLGLPIHYSGVNVLNVIFTLLFILVIAFVVKPDALRRPPVAILVFLLAFLAIYASVTDFLMLAIMLLAYYFMDNKYLWILLGVAASLQEQLWIVVVLMLIYSFRNRGARRGLTNLLGAVLIFVLINGYFIAANPPAFISQVFAPVSGYILPGPQGPIGFSIFMIYGTLLSSQGVLFVFAAALSIILFAWLNEKRLIFLLAMLPLMFLYHAILPYYTLFLAAVIVTLYIRDTKGTARSGRLPSALSSKVALSCIALLALSLAVLLVYSHNALVKVGISVTNSTLLPPVSNYTLYNASLHYSSNSLGQLTLQEFVMYDGYPVPVAYGNQGNRILIQPNYNLTNGSLPYKINPNRIPLTGQSGTVNLSVSAPSNAITRVGIAECVIYGGPYYYICPPARASK